MEKNNKKQRYISGLVGEDIAINEMKKCGFEIVRHRYKTSSGEIDLIAENKEKKLLVFVEVKRRKTIYDYDTVVTKRQWRRIYNAGNEFIAENYEKYKNYSIRYDEFICFTNSDNTHHIENIFPIDDNIIN